MRPQSKAEMSEIIEHKIRRATGLSALRAIRKLVDTLNEEEKAKQKTAKRILLVFGLIIIATLFWGGIMKGPTWPSKTSPALEYANSVAIQIERSANENYPQELREKNSHGIVTVSLSITSSGHLQNTEIRTTSGDSLLDKTAIRLIENAGPFPPAQEELRKQIDIFEIARSFKFENDKVTQHP